MKKVIIDGKEYWQQEQSDIDKLPKMDFSEDMLTNKSKSWENITKWPINQKEKGEDLAISPPTF